MTATTPPRRPGAQGHPPATQHLSAHTGSHSPSHAPRAAHPQRPPHHHPVPGKEEIALLEPFERLSMDRITLVHTPEQADRARDALCAATAWGFDTESKPTFVRDEVSEGPHIVQLATLDHAWVFQLQDAGCRARVAELLALQGVAKAGFGLGDDTKRIQARLGVAPADVVELNTVFRQRGYRKDMGVKAAVAVLFHRRFLKSKKAATSNWANERLTEAQVLYAANDAWAALRVFHALQGSAASRADSPDKHLL